MTATTEVGAPSCQETVEGLRQMVLDARRPLGAADGSDTPLGQLPSCRALAIETHQLAAARAIELGGLVDECNASVPEAARHCFVEPWPAVEPGATSTCAVLSSPGQWSEACLGAVFQRAGPWSVGRGELCSRRFPELRALYSKTRAAWDRAMKKTPKVKVDRSTTRCN